GFVAGRAHEWQSAPAKDFPLVGGNFANQRYSTLARINASNIGRLGGAWMVHLEGGRGGTMQGTPVVVDGTMFISTGHVSAIDAKTGEVKWRYPAESAGAAGASGPGRGGSNRGVVAAEGKVFSASANNTLIAIDQ